MQGGCRAATGGSAAPNPHQHPNCNPPNKSTHPKLANRTPVRIPSPTCPPTTTTSADSTGTTPSCSPDFHPDEPASAPDLDNPNILQPLYTAGLEQLAQHAKSDHDRLSALYLLAAQHGCARVKDQLLKLAETSTAHRVMLTVVYLIARALGMVVPREPARLNLGGRPGPALPGPSILGASFRWTPTLPYPRLPIPRKRSAKRPKPAEPTPPPIAGRNASLSPPIAGGDFPLSHPIPGGDTEGDSEPPPNPTYHNLRRRFLRDLGKLPPEPPFPDFLRHPRDPPPLPAG